MFISSQYQLLDTLHENMSTIVYRAIRLKDKEQVIVKMLKPGERSEPQMAQFINEQQILSML